MRRKYFEKNEYKIIKNKHLEELNNQLNYTRNICNEIITIQSIIKKKIDALEYLSDNYISFTFYTQNSYEQLVVKIKGKAENFFCLAEKYRRSKGPRNTDITWHRVDYGRDN